MLNFGGYRGDAILGQALQNAAGTLERKHQMAQEKKYKDAYLAMQQQYADQAKVNAQFANYFNAEKMREMKMNQADASFARSAFANYELKENPIQHSDRFFGSDFEAKESTANQYLTPKSKNVLRQAYQAQMQEAGFEYDPTRFDRIYGAVLGRQAQQVSSYMTEAGMIENSPDDINKAMHKSGAGSVISQALLAGADPATMSPMYTPQGYEGGITWGDVGKTALGAPVGMAQFGQAGGVVKQAMRAGKAGGAGAGAKQAVATLSGQSFKKNAANIIKLASTEGGREVLTQRLAKKGGMPFARKMVAKLAIKAGGAGAVNAIPVVGQIASVGLTALTIKDLYDIMTLLGE